MEFDEYEGYDGLGLAGLVAGGEATAADLLSAAQARADAVNAQINAIVLRQDADAEQRAAGPLEGPFAGVPFLLKDLRQEYAGVPSTSGCRALARVPAREHATVVRRWLDAGLVVFGRTNVPEFGAKGITESDLYGPARNPWNLDRTTGGSSGGSAAAVAAGIVPVAGASDGGGSIRIPAACCGLFGLKASRGLIPSGPDSSEGLHGLGTDGVVSRTVRDSAAMLDVLAGPDAVAATDVRPHGSYLAAIEDAPGPLRIGVQTTSPLAPVPHPEARAAVDAAVAALEELGHHVETAPPPVDDAALARDFLTIWFVSAAGLVHDVRAETGAGPEGFELDTQIMAALGRAISGVAHRDALASRDRYIAQLAAFHARYDLLLTPTLARPPLRVGELTTPRPAAAAARALLRSRTTRILPHVGLVDDMIEKNLGWVPFTQLANMTGRPAMSVPLHWTADGVPLGVQFVAPLAREALLLRLAAQLEQARPWADRRPTLAGARPATPTVAR